MAKRAIKSILNSMGMDIARYNKAKSTYVKMYQKYRDFTMVPEATFVSNLELASNYKHVFGDFVECGVWRGGMAAAIAELVGKDKTVHLFDSFEGLPEAQEIDGSAAIQWQNNKTSDDYYDNCTADESFAVKAMTMAGNVNYKLYKGWFNETLDGYPGAPISILRLDGDWYESIKICLEKLFPFVSEGGLVILDDYYTWDGCSKAVHEYLGSSGTASRILQWNNGVAYIVKKK